MDYRNYIHKLIRSFRENPSERFMFIKHYNTLLISEHELHEIVVGETSDMCLLFYEFPKHVMQEPYGPFLNWIRELYYKYFRDMTPEEFVENAGVYSLQQEVFTSFIRDGVGKRREDILLIELEYEREQMIRSILRIYAYVSQRKPIFVFLEKMHLANISCLQLICKVIHITNREANMQLFGMFSEVYRVPEYVEPIWRKFLTVIEKENIQFEWGSAHDRNETDEQYTFVPKDIYMGEYVHMAANMYYFLAIEDAKQHMSAIYDRIKQGLLKAKDEQKVQFYQLYAIHAIMCEDYSRALQLCEYLSEYGKANKKDDVLYSYYYISAMCQFGMEQLEDKVENYIDACQEIARRNGDALAVYKAEVLRVLSNNNYWRGVFGHIQKTRIPEGFYEETKKWGFRNIYCYLNVYCFDDDPESIREIIEGKREMEKFNKGVRMAKELGNMELISCCFTKNVVLYSRQDAYNIVDQLYQQKLEALGGEIDELRKVHTYNGMGYNAAVSEHYQRAQEYFDAALETVLRIGDGCEAAVVLYNSAVNKMLAREFFSAAEDLTLMLQIMELMQVNSINVCDTSRLYGMLGFCSYYTGEEYRCYSCLNRIDAYVRHLEFVQDENRYANWHNTMFMKHLIQGMIYNGDAKYEEAEKEFEKAEFHQQQERGDQFLNYPLFIVEKAKLFENQRMEKERVAVLEAGIEFCGKKGYHAKENMLAQMLQHRVERVYREPLAKHPISNEKIIQIVERLAIRKQLEINKGDIDFILVWQELFSKTIEAEEMMKCAITMMKNFFSFDGVIAINSQGQPCIEYSELPETNPGSTYVSDRIRGFTELELEKIVDYFSHHKSALLTNRIEKGFLEYQSLLEILDIHHLITLYAYPVMDSTGKITNILMGYVEMRNNYIGNRYLLQEHDFVILRSFSSQLYVAIERLDTIRLIHSMNSQLSAMAKRDVLTGLYNRQGFQRMLEEEASTTEKKNVIIYIDLDNFKYYNDTFGHGLGDFVLVEFSHILKHVVSNIGYAVRYGGDEFILVLQNKTIEDGKFIAQTIMESIRDELNAIVANKIGVDVKLPKEKRLSCSIGIAMCNGYDKEQITEAINKADKGLYYIKKTTKGNYIVWDELS